MPLQQEYLEKFVDSRPKLKEHILEANYFEAVGLLIEEALSLIQEKYGLEKKMGSLDTEKNKLQRKYEELLQVLKNAKRHSSGLKMSIENDAAYFDELNEDIDRQLKTQREQHLAELVNERKKLRQEILEAREDLEELKEGHKKEIDVWRKRVMALKNEIKELKDEIEFQETTNHEAEKEMELQFQQEEFNERKIKELKQQLTDKEDDLIGKKNEILKLEEKLKLQRSEHGVSLLDEIKATEKNEEIIRLKTELEEIKNKLNAKEAESELQARKTEENYRNSSYGTSDCDTFEDSTYFSDEEKKNGKISSGQKFDKPVINVTLLASSPIIGTPVDIAKSQQVQKLEPENEAAELLANLIEIYQSLMNREQEAIPVFNNTIKMIGNKISGKMDCYAKDHIELVQAYPSLVHRFWVGSYIWPNQAVDLLLGNFSESLAANAAKFPQALYTLAYVLNDLAKTDKSIETAIKKSLDKGKGSHDFANKLKIAVKPLLEKQAKNDIDPYVENALAILTKFIDSGREIGGIYKKIKLKSLNVTPLEIKDTNAFLQSLDCASVENMNRSKETENAKIKKSGFFSRFFSKNKVVQVKQSETIETTIPTNLYADSFRK